MKIKFDPVINKTFLSLSGAREHILPLNLLASLTISILEKPVRTWSLTLFLAKSGLFSTLKNDETHQLEYNENF